MSQPTRGRTARRIVGAACLWICAMSAATGTQTRTQLPVSATVLAMAHLEQLSTPFELLLSAADLQRGYVDVPLATRLVVRSNSAAGFALEVAALNPMISNIVVEGLASPQVLGSEGGTLVQRWNGAQSQRLSLRFRFFLAPDTLPGRYPWPLYLSVRPL